MTPERWGRIVDLFGAVADLPTALRVECLTYECREEPGLRREVEALLRADAAVGDGAFIRRAVAGEMADMGFRPFGAADGPREAPLGPADRQTRSP